MGKMIFPRASDDFDRDGIDEVLFVHRVGGKKHAGKQNGHDDQQVTVDFCQNGMKNHRYRKYEQVPQADKDQVAAPDTQTKPRNFPFQL